MPARGYNRLDERRGVGLREEICGRLPRPPRARRGCSVHFPIPRFPTETCLPRVSVRPPRTGEAARQAARLPKYREAVTLSIQARALPNWRVRRRYVAASSRSARRTQERDFGARGGGRTHTSCEGQGILSPPRMPFRHPGFLVRLALERDGCNRRKGQEGIGGRACEGAGWTR